MEHPFFRKACWPYESDTGMGFTYVIFLHPKRYQTTNLKPTKVWDICNLRNSIPPPAKKRVYCMYIDTFSSFIYVVISWKFLSYTPTYLKWSNRLIPIIPTRELFLCDNLNECFRITLCIGGFFTYIPPPYRYVNERPEIALFTYHFLYLIWLQINLIMHNHIIHMHHLFM